jgi:hypothetical protein
MFAAWIHAATQTAAVFAPAVKRVPEGNVQRRLPSTLHNTETASHVQAYVPNLIWADLAVSRLTADQAVELPMAPVLRILMTAPGIAAAA